MRLYFPNLARPKKAAKHIAAVTKKPLAICQSGVAQACGYRDRYDLEVAHSQLAPTVLDQYLTEADFVDRHADLTLGLSSALNISDGDAQHALAGSRLIGDREVTLASQIEIRLACFRRNALPLARRRERGATGILRSPGRNREIAILRSFGRPTTAITEYNVLTLADFEFISPHELPPLFLPMRLSALRVLGGT